MWGGEEMCMQSMVAPCTSCAWWLIHPTDCSRNHYWTSTLSHEWVLGTHKWLRHHCCFPGIHILVRELDQQMRNFQTTGKLWNIMDVERWGPLAQPGVQSDGGWCREDLLEDHMDELLLKGWRNSWWRGGGKAVQAERTVWLKAWRGTSDNHKAFSVLDSTTRDREWHGRDGEIGDIQGGVLWPFSDPREPNVLEELTRHREEELFDESNSESERIHPVKLRWSWVYIRGQKLWPTGHIWPTTCFCT